MHGFVIILLVNEVLNWNERDPICIDSMGNHEVAGAFSEHKNSSCSSSISLSNQSTKLAVSLLVLSGTQYRDLQLEHCAEGETALCWQHGGWIGQRRHGSLGSVGS